MKRVLHTQGLGAVTARLPACKRRGLAGLSLLLLAAALLYTRTLSAAVFSRLENDQNIIGRVQTVQILPGDTLAQLARAYDVGYYEMIEANPAMNPDNLKAGSVLIVPSQYILPDVPQKGVVINLAEMRLYYFPPDSAEVFTYPVGIGRVDWSTPKGAMHIVEKRANPTWHVPKSIQKARAEEGLVLPDAIPPGPDNPLGEYAMRLSLRTYLIHGTNHPEGVGRRSSSGCIRLYPEDIEELYELTEKGTPVRIIDVPVKLGWFQSQLFLEVHQALQENALHKSVQISRIRGLVKHAMRYYKPAMVDWSRVESVIREEAGVPLPVTDLLDDRRIIKHEASESEDFGPPPWY